MAKYLLDTNHLSYAIRRVTHLRDRLRAAVREGSQFATCWPAMCELEVGIRQTSNPESVRRTLRIVLQDVRIWPMDWNIVNAYGGLRLFTKANGKALSYVDHVLASFAECMDAILLTTDGDFQGIPGLRFEDWITET